MWVKNPPLPFKSSQKPVRYRINMNGVLNVNSLNKKFRMTLVGGFTRFISYNFVYFFMNTLAANRGLFYWKHNKPFHSWTFAPVMWTIPKIKLFCKFLRFLVGRVMIWLTEIPFKNLIDVDGRLRSENFAVMPTCFLSTMAELIALDRVRSHFPGNLSQIELSLVPHTIISLTKNTGGYQVHIRNLTFWIQSENHDKCEPLAACMWKNLWRKMIVFFIGLQYSKNL